MIHYATPYMTPCMSFGRDRESWAKPLRAEDESQIGFHEVSGVVGVNRGFGLYGDMVISLTSGDKLELRSIPECALLVACLWMWLLGRGVDAAARDRMQCARTGASVGGGPGACATSRLRPPIECRAVQHFCALIMPQRAAPSQLQVQSTTLWHVLVEGGFHGMRGCRWQEVRDYILARRDAIRGKDISAEELMGA